ncbi:hypothetical protein [Alteromonas sp. H39]|uniref:chorismate transformation enzyme, FkbO/Hyg5 family n=1 Tax=Alteromonas sp. H39 TaxID=3389876 RepID=UPI0039E10BAA
MLNQSFTSQPVDDVINDDHTLAVIPLVSNCEPYSPGVIPSGTAVAKAESAQVNEVWTVSGKVTRGQTGANYWSKTDDVICVAQWLSKDECKDIEQETERAYTSMLSLLQDEGFTHPFRFWNYLPKINYGKGDEELYKKFCTGRLNAFNEQNIEPSSFPAASALGHHSDGAVFYVFASKSKPQHFKNVQQVNAYEYPRQYGISSPSFARATALTLAQSPFLFISGTASIIGHKSVEIGNLERQLDVTLANIEWLLENANPENTRLEAFKVYVRHEQHVAQTRNWLAARFPDVAAVFVIADICRKELLVEIECFCL